MFFLCIVDLSGDDDQDDGQPAVVWKKSRVDTPGNRKRRLATVDDRVIAFDVNKKPKTDQPDGFLFTLSFSLSLYFSLFLSLSFSFSLLLSFSLAFFLFVSFSLTREHDVRCLFILLSTVSFGHEHVSQIGDRLRTKLVRHA